MRVLEFGPGASTLAFVEAGAEVVTLESDASRAAAAAEVFAGVSAVRVFAYENHKRLALPAGCEGAFDLAFVDGPPVPGGPPFARFKTAAVAAERAAVVLLHDARRERERRVMESLCGQGLALEFTFESRRGIAVLRRTAGAPGATGETDRGAGCASPS